MVERVENLPAEDIDRIWRETEWLNAQVPVGLRKIIGLIQTLPPAEQEEQFRAFMIGQLMDVRSAITNDESKYAHLVAGTETIVKEMQHAVELSRHIEELREAVDVLGQGMLRLTTMVESFLPREQAPVVAESHHVEDYDESEPSDEPSIEDRKAEEARSKTIGSAWAK